MKIIVLILSSVKAQGNCDWKQWTNWSSCRPGPTPCAGAQTRIRFCNGPIACCNGKSTDYRTCITPEPACQRTVCSKWSNCCPSDDVYLQQRTCSRLGSGDNGTPEQRKCSVDEPWNEWSQCSVSCGTGVQIRERELPGCDNGTEIDQLECFAGACLKRASPGLGDTKCDVIKQDTLLQLQLMMIENCAPYQWTQWSQCANKCSGRRSRIALSHETETIQYEWCHKLNSCQTMDCNENWQGWSAWQVTDVGGIQARARTNECNDNDFDYRNTDPVNSLIDSTKTTPAPTQQTISARPRMPVFNPDSTETPSWDDLGLSWGSP